MGAFDSVLQVSLREMQIPLTYSLLGKCKIAFGKNSFVKTTYSVWYIIFCKGLLSFFFILKKQTLRRSRERATVTDEPNPALVSIA